MRAHLDLKIGIAVLSGTIFVSGQLFAVADAASPAEALVDREAYYPWADT